VSTLAAPFSLPGWPRGWRLRDALLTGFFAALAFSISGSQALLAALFLLVLPWASAARSFGSRGWLAGVAREIWTDAEPLRRHPLTPPLLAYTALSILSAVFSGDPGGSLWLARDTLRITTFYLVLWYTRDAVHALRLWTGFLAVLTVMATYGLVQAYLCGGQPGGLPGGWVINVCPHPSRVSGPFSIYMTFGGVLLLGALFMVSYLANVSWRRVWWMVPAGAITVAALAFTYSRNAWLGLVAGTPMLDLDYSEDSTAEVDMNVVMTGVGRFVEVQGTAEQTPFDLGQLEALLRLAQGGIGRLLDLQRRVLADRATSVFTLP